MFAVVHNIALCALALNLLPSVAVYAQRPSRLDSSARTAMHSIAPYPLRLHTEFLGSDALEGRGTGTNASFVAATYLASELRKLRLLPLGEDSTYYQNIPMHGSKPLPQTNLQFFGKRGDFALRLGEDYLLDQAGPYAFIAKPAPLVFVGYGIVAPEYDYNDYQALEVEGKIVVFFEGEPRSRDRRYFEGEELTLHSLLRTKQNVALARGALGSILIPNTREAAHRTWPEWQREFAFEDIHLYYSVARNLGVILNPQSAERLFEDAAYSLEELDKKEATNTLPSFSLPVRAAFRGSFEQRDFLAANVVGMLPGREAQIKNPYVLITAHYDHLGLGPSVRGDSIYNGVFDNAVGVAAVLEIARAFSALPTRPARTLLFLFLTGEEHGMLGSTFYTDHPLVPLHQTAANLNVDGLALFDMFEDLVGVGAEFSTLGELLSRVAGEIGLGVSEVPAPFSSSMAFARSDQFAFAAAGIPSLLIMEGQHYRNTSYEEGLRRMIRWGQEIYHSPFDDLRQSLNYDAATQHTRALFAFCYALAQLHEPPQWRANTPFNNARLRSIAEQR